MEKKGIFIAFEGVDGAGKTTCLNHLSDRLEREGFGVVKTREPGGSPVAEKIRQIILEENLDGYSEALLFAAARNDHVRNTILPALEKGMIVLSDRFLSSSLAYQGEGRNLGMEEVESVNDWFLKGFRPDLILYFSAPQELLEKRRQQRGEQNRLDEESRTFYERIEKGFEAQKDSMTLIDASGSEEEVAELAYQKLKPMLKNLSKKTGV